MTLPPDTVDELWVAHDGVWVAAATGRHTHVQLTAQPATRVRHPQLVTRPDPVRAERPTQGPTPP